MLLVFLWTELQLVHEKGHNRSKDLLTDFERYRETLQ